MHNAAARQFVARGGERLVGCALLVPDGTDGTRARLIQMAVDNGGAGKGGRQGFSTGTASVRRRGGVSRSALPLPDLRGRFLPKVRFHRRGGTLPGGRNIPPPYGLRFAEVGPYGRLGCAVTP